MNKSKYIVCHRVKSTVEKKEERKMNGGVAILECPGKASLR